MSKWLVRYMLVGDNDMMMLRRMLCSWRPYRLISTLRNEKLDLLNKKAREIEKILADIKEIDQLQYRETKRINDGIANKYGWGPVLPDKVKRPWWPMRVPSTEMTDFTFEKILRAFRTGGNSKAAEFAELSGAEVTEVDGHPVRGSNRHSTTDGGDNLETCGEKSFEVKPEQRGQQRKRGQNNQQN
jgi:hypothetical protein